MHYRAVGRFIHPTPSKYPCLCCHLHDYNTGLSPTLGYKNATAADAVPNPMQGGTKFPQISQVLNVVRLFSPELVAYLQNPKTVCTVIAPTNKVYMKILCINRSSSECYMPMSVATRTCYMIPDLYGQIGLSGCSCATRLKTAANVALAAREASCADIAATFLGIFNM